MTLRHARAMVALCAGVLAALLSAGCAESWGLSPAYRWDAISPAAVASHEVEPRSRVYGLFVAPGWFHDDGAVELPEST